MVNNVVTAENNTVGLNMTILGTVRYHDLEGGFWGIEGDDNNKYKPINAIPDKFLVDGCRVKAEVEPANVISFTMWGQMVNVLNIESQLI